MFYVDFGLICVFSTHTTAQILRTWRFGCFGRSPQALNPDSEYYFGVDLDSLGRGFSFTTLMVQMLRRGVRRVRQNDETTPVKVFLQRQIKRASKTN